MESFCSQLATMSLATINADTFLTNGFKIML
jgi:hypothetical protein